MADDLAVLVAQGRDGVGDADVGAVAAHERPLPQLGSAGRKRREHGPARLDAELPGGRLDLLGQVQLEGAHPADHLVRRVAEQPLGAVVEERENAVPVRREDGVAGRDGEHPAVVVALAPQSRDQRVAAGRVQARPAAAEQRSREPPHPPNSGHGVATTVMVPTRNIGGIRARLSGISAAGGGSRDGLDDARRDRADLGAVIGVHRRLEADRREPAGELLRHAGERLVEVGDGLG